MPAETSIESAAAAPPWSSHDPSSFSQPHLIVITSAHIQWTVDFDERIVSGCVQLVARRLNPDVGQLILDTRRLRIDEVSDSETGERLSFRLDSTQDQKGGENPLGVPLVIDLPPCDAAEACERAVRITVRYATAAGGACTALAWLSGAQTAGGRLPFVFSQCQAILCRSLLPCQDTPSVKFTYTADVRVPAGLTALMSALPDSGDGGSDAASTATAVFRFRQPVPIPSYLIALAVGRLERRQLSDRCGVWAEPETVAAAADEFAETERMLSIAEQLCGEYVWQRYDMLVLPPSFPFGGMENPCLTFLTPTLLAGDRSLADVVAHEICHSWTGNLVTNRNWEHFWLNEGLTTFFERKVRGRMFGEPERHLSAIVGWRSLSETVERMGSSDISQPEFTRLVPRLSGAVDPDDAFSCVPYEKGHTLLMCLERLVGGPQVFEPCLRAYIAAFKYKTVDSDDFRRFLTQYFATGDGDGCAADVATRLAEFDWSAWLDAPGMPPSTPDFDRQLTDACGRLAQRWADWTPAESSDAADPAAAAASCPFAASDIDSYSASQLIELLGQLVELRSSLCSRKLVVMERLYDMESRRNSEVRFRWLRLCIAARRLDKIDACLRFVSEQGRMKFTRPIYRDLAAWPEARPRAEVNYKTTKSAMMNMAAAAIAKDLELSV